MKTAEGEYVQMGDKDMMLEYILNDSNLLLRFMALLSAKRNYNGDDD